MIKNIIICDKCKKEIEKGTEIYKLEAICTDQESGEVKDIIKQGNGHYHKECVREILALVSADHPTKNTKATKQSRQGTGERTKSPAAAGKAKKTGPKEEVIKELDIGKIMALREAGWTYEDIAHELKTTKTRIASAIYKHRHKDEK